MSGLIHICTGGPIRRISIGGKIHTFEMHPYCGPVLLKKDGEPSLRQPMKFLEAASQWVQQGGEVNKRFDLCQYDPSIPLV